VVVCTAVVDGVFGRERVLEHLRTDRQTDTHPITHICEDMNILNASTE